ncbi:MAG: 4Fe-4S dicluster domain-containing protein [Planctomycetes bacterium]|jgi:ferredoxin|nr:4Fe-4S dicluster domain-containing protein [Planctomycetota bacterium]
MSIERGILESKDWKRLAELLPGTRVLAPLPDGAGDWAFAELAPGQEPALSSPNVRLSPKGILLPACETLCRYDAGGMREETPPEGKTVLFGVRPCDARALALLDRVFGESATSGFEDPYYLRRRADTTVVALACTDPRPTCFCTSVEGAPASAEGADALAFDLGGRLLLEGITEKGRDLLKALGKALRPPKDYEIRAREEQAAAAAAKVPPVKAKGVKARLDREYESPLWDAIAERCLGCGACAYLCPTCHCFDVVDEGKEGAGRRVRTWDCCQYSMFTHHGSGHNPRPSRKERARQRIMHKFRYNVDNFQKTFCVGCGRCVQYCPVNVDVRETLEALSSE